MIRKQQEGLAKFAAQNLEQLENADIIRFCLIPPNHLPSNAACRIITVIVCKSHAMRAAIYCTFIWGLRIHFHTLFSTRPSTHWDRRDRLSGLLFACSNRRLDLFRNDEIADGLLRPCSSTSAEFVVPVLETSLVLLVSLDRA